MKYAIFTFIVGLCIAYIAIPSYSLEEKLELDNRESIKGLIEQANKCLTEASKL
jgi:hypothetical protein